MEHSSGSGKAVWRHLLFSRRCCYWTHILCIFVVVESLLEHHEEASAIYDGSDHFCRHCCVGVHVTGCARSHVLFDGSWYLLVHCFTIDGINPLVILNIGAKNPVYIICCVCVCFVAYFSYPVAVFPGILALESGVKTCLLL